MRIVVLGAPGAGKGTQARNLAKYYKAPHVSTGDVLREQITRQTEVGEKIKPLMDKGQLVPDEIVTRMIIKNIADGDFILDGYPRTLEQAGVLEYLTDVCGLPLDKVVKIDVADDIITERMTGRVYCVSCGTTYHTHYFPPKTRGKCNVCGGALEQREDDKALTVQRRLEVYHESTEPIIKFYRGKGLLLTVSGIGEIGEITHEIITELGERGAQNGRFDKNRHGN